MNSMIINEARTLAIEAHKGQKRRNGDDYFKAHVQKVVEYLFENYHTFISTTIQWGYKKELRECVICAAYLHDVVEDTPITLDLIEVSFGPLIRDMVDVLTKRQGESYFDFIMRIHDSSSIVVPCRAIKIADISCNMADATETDKLGSQYAKYELARYILKRMN